MSEQRYEIRLVRPSAEEFVSLRQGVGWGKLDMNLAEQSLGSALFDVTVYCHGSLVGMSRVVGDGYLYFYLQDVIVDPDHQSQGVGKIIMQQLESYIEKAAAPGSTVGLLAAKGREGFYRSYGYEQRSGDRLGLGMSKFR